MCGKDKRECSLLYYIGFLKAAKCEMGSLDYGISCIEVYLPATLNMVGRASNAAEIVAALAL